MLKNCKVDFLGNSKVAFHFRVAGGCMQSLSACPLVVYFLHYQANKQFFSRDCCYSKRNYSPAREMCKKVPKRGKSVFFAQSGKNFILRFNFSKTIHSIIYIFCKTNNLDVSCKAAVIETNFRRLTRNYNHFSSRSIDVDLYGTIKNLIHKYFHSYIYTL